MGLLGKKSKKEDQPKEPKAKKVDLLIDPEEARAIKERFIESRIGDLYKAKMKNFDKDGEDDRIIISEGFRLSSDYITTQVLEALPTGDVRFDVKCSVDRDGNRGIPRGKVIELSGAPETMKSARAYHILSHIQKDPRGAIINIYETESKANARYIGAAGCNVDEIVVTLPNYIEQVYYDMERVMKKFLKARNTYVANFTKKHGKKSMTEHEYEALMFRARMSFPILVFLYDSIGNHISMEQYQKNEAGKTTKTIGKHAQAHADGMRSIRNGLGDSLGVMVAINHTKVEMGGGMTAGWGGQKKTTTYGGDSIKYMSDIRVENRPSVGIGDKTIMMKVTRDGEEVVVGKWIGSKFLKNSLLDSSQQKVENILFRYKVGFDIGASYMIAMYETGMMKAPPSIKPGKKNDIVLPGGETIQMTFIEFGQYLEANPETMFKIRSFIENYYNERSTLVRKDIG